MHDSGPEAPTPPRDLDGCENKGFSRQGTCKYMKIKSGVGGQAGKGGCIVVKTKGGPRRRQTITHPSRLGGKSRRERGVDAELRRLGEGGGHPRGDGKYAQSNVGTGDRGATWRRRRALPASRTGTLVILNRGFRWDTLPPFFHKCSSVHSKGS